jgi:hypothetical protein
LKYKGNIQKGFSEPFFIKHYGTLFEIQNVKRHIKAVKFLSASFFIVWMITVCNNSTGKASALDVTDSSSSNPSSDAMDYHPDQ